MASLKAVKRRAAPALAVIAIFLSGAPASAQSAPNPKGTTSASNLPVTLLSSIQARSAASLATAAATFTNAQYATGGVALRNRTQGSIHISGVTGTVKSAVMYWAILVASAPSSTSTIPSLCGTAVAPNNTNFGFPTQVCGPVTGTLIATGADPCWGSAGIAIYRANVTSLVGGNGVYQITLGAQQSATGSGGDPWASPLAFPAAEGASLVVVGTGAQTVSIFDQGFSGSTFSGTLNYSLSLASPVAKPPVLWDNIGADGQIGASRTATVANEKTTINGVLISGPPGTSDTDSDWDGSSGFPLPQLWDDTGHDITAAAPLGTPSLAVQFNSSGDCLTPIANVVAY